jgi:uncharacterized membrane protein
MELDSLTNNAQTTSSVLPPATGSANINVGPTERIASAFLGALGTSYGLRHIGSYTGLTALLAGGFLLSRGLTGYCSFNQAFGRNSNQITRKTSAMEIGGTFIINKPKSEVYNFWRKLENLPLFMKHLEKVKEEDSINSTWTARVPGGLGVVSWKATITEDKPEESLSWASQPGSTIDTAGEVKFEDAPNGSGTQIKVCMTYRAPGGDVGQLAGKLFNSKVEKMMKEDVMRFKTIMESGEFELSGTKSTSTASSSSTSSFDSDTEFAKPKKSRARKSPDTSFSTGSSYPDSSLQSSPSNESGQPGLTPESTEESERWDKAR